MLRLFIAALLKFPWLSNSTESTDEYQKRRRQNKDILTEIMNLDLTNMKLIGL
jgi:hypothetical protein